MFDDWACPDSSDTVVAPGVYDLRLHVSALTGDVFTTARVHVKEPRSIAELDSAMTANNSGNPATIIGIKFLPAEVVEVPTQEDTVTLSKEQYKTLMMLARRGANPPLGHTSQLWVRAHTKKLDAIEKEHG